MNIKYISDGRKVAVVEKINSEECIVQEIFVTEDGDEIPSGEKFTTKSLHDKPVISYLDRQEAKQKELISKLEAKYNDSSYELSIIVKKLKANREILKNSNIICSLKNTLDFDTLISFLSGTIQWVVVDDHQINKPKELVDEIMYKDNFGITCRNEDYDGLKLISVFGSSEGNLSYKIHEYHEGSGNSKTMHLFDSYETAIEQVKFQALKMIEKGHLSEPDYKKCLDMEIAFSDHDYDKYLDSLRKSLNASLATFTESLAKGQAKIDRINSKLSELKWQTKRLAEPLPLATR